MYSGLLIILLPLVIGYLLPLKSPGLQRLLNCLLSWMVYIILFFMGISLAFLDNLAANLLAIVHIASVSVIAILACNLIALRLLEKRRPWRHQHHQEALPSRLHMALESLKLLGVVVLGFLLGLTGWTFLHHATEASEYALIVAAVVCLSAFVGGILAALMLGLPLTTGLALASGYGWYSLSGILMTESFGPVIGSAAFFNDLLRELLAIMLIPALIRQHRSSALGLCGATSMDFTLPVLQRAGGIEIVPAAIVHGFALSLAAPVLIALFSS
ncbi:MAG: lysine exporter LysO family protein [Pantoea sp.]|nr:lysine exporter LysO family protein [Pantoea sp.]